MPRIINVDNVTFVATFVWDGTDVQRITIDYRLMAAGQAVSGPKVAVVDPTTNAQKNALRATFQAIENQLKNSEGIT